MNNKQYHEILNLINTIFEINEYKRMVVLVQEHKFNQLRLLCSEKLEMLNLLNQWDNNVVIKTQISKCNKLEDIFISLYVDNLTKV